MKNNLSILLLLFLVFSCKKDEKITSVSRDNIILEQNNDSLSIADSSKTVYSKNNALNIKPLDETAEVGKAVFQKNNSVLIVFNHRSQKGIMTIEGKEYQLDSFVFSENNYEISGNGIKITAENGNFKEQDSDCFYANFPNVKITLNDREINLENINVQDCPAY